MPLMASVTDPGNLAEHGRVLSGGCANLVLGGPRNIRRGLELLRLVRARGSAGGPEAAVRFLGWPGPRGAVPEVEVARALQEDSVLGRGFLLCRELGLLASRKTDAGKTFEVRRPG
jgi:hypothetical protein